MTPPPLDRLARAIVNAGGPTLPSFILTRQAPIFEVEFEALEFAEYTKLPACDWAALSLADALGEISPRDIDAYLGLGDLVSQALVHRLIEAGMLLEESPSTESPPYADLDLFGAVRRRRRNSHTEPVPPRERRASLARSINATVGADLPRCWLSGEGVEALRQGAVARRRNRSLRALFVTQPLHYLDTVDEKRHRYSAHRRPAVLDPESVPACLQTLDDVLGLPPEDRVTMSGILRELSGVAGELIGVVPGTQWAVRPGLLGKPHRLQAGEPATATLVLAAFPTSDADGLIWRTFVKLSDRVADAPLLPPERLLDPAVRSLASLLTEANRSAPAEISPAGLRADGAFTVPCVAERFAALVGDHDHPEDAYLTVPAFEDWTLGVRAHVVPADAAAGCLAFYLYLRRRETELRADFDATCAVTSEMLTTYWGEQHELPTTDEVVRELWSSRELRAALCKRRLHADLVAPYMLRELA